MSDISQHIAGLNPAQLEILTRHLKQKRSEVSTRQSIPRRDPDTKPALSFAQQRMWFLDQLDPGQPLYNIAVAVKLIGQLNIVALEKSINEIVKRHEVLRTTFQVTAGTPWQQIADTQTLPLRVVDLRELPVNEREAEARREAIEEAREPFNLERGPLLRVVVLQLAEAENVMLLTMHHIISDGWSSGVFFREVAMLYQAFANGEPSPLAPLPVQYADFAVWQRERLSGEVMEEHLAYWKRQLEETAPVLELPADRPRPAAQTHRGAVHYFKLSYALSDALRLLSKTEGTTLFVVVLAAFKALLSRYTGQTDILVGSPVANRSYIETEPLIGLFVNTLVLRTHTSGNPSFRELLKRVREVVLRGHEYQELPFERLVTELQTERSLSHAPLFQVEFFLDNRGHGATEVAGLQLQPIKTESGTAKFDLTLAMEDAGSLIAGRLEYSVDLFEEATIVRMARHFENVLEGIVADPERRLSELPLLSEEEQQQLLVTWNDTDRSYPQSKCLHEQFEEQVERTPDATALVYEEQQVSYRELNERANELAHELRDRAVGPETVVALLLERSVEMMVAILGVLKAGGAYLPLDPSYPAERLSYMMADSGAALLVSKRELVERVGVEPAAVVFIEEIAGRSAENPGHHAAPENLAYVIYTSGSSGQPKGVQMTHAAPANLLEALRERVYEGARLEGVRATLNASFTFDASVQQWLLLLTGATLYLIPERLRSDGAGLLEYLREHDVEIMDCTPSQLRVLMSSGLLDGSGRAPRRLLVAGEAIDSAMWEQLQQQQEGKQIYNIYGPTECCVDASAYPVRAEGWKRPVIGKPLGNYQVYVLDEWQQPVPVWVRGEIYIGGPGLARGYLRQAALTAERFVPNSFSNEPGARLYRTGDVGRYLPDGNIEYLGRADGQVKLRGYRVELEEVEAALRGCRGVQEAVVVLRSGLTGEQRLVGYLVEAETGAVRLEELRSELSERLPDYMIPAVFVKLEEFPLNRNGKVKRRELPDPGGQRPELVVGYVAPRTEDEATLVQIWQEVLGLDLIGVEDNFFDLGGHSLLATQVISRVREALHTELPLRALFEAPTIAGLCEKIRAEKSTSPDAMRASVTRRNRDGDAPLSFAQERLWFLDQLEPGSTVYNSSAAIRLAGPLDIAALERGLNEVVSRHEILRTVFVSNNGRPQQSILPALHIEIPVTDVSEYADAVERTAQARLVEEANQSFDLSIGPMLRARLLRFASEEHVLLFTVHHIVSDAWSINIMIRELSKVYNSLLTGEQVRLSELPVQYADYAAWQRELLSGAELERQLSYWRQQLAGSPALLELNTDRPRPRVQTSNGAQYVFTIPEALTDRLKKLSRREGVTLYMTLLAAWQTLLSRYSGQTDIVVGSPIAGRTRLEIEELIGFFINTLVLRTDLSGEVSFAELMQRVREVTLGAYAHQDVPFEKLVEELQPERDMSRSPLFQVTFMLLNTPEEAVELGDLRVSEIAGENRAAKFDLELAMSERQNDLYCSLVYNTDLFDTATIVRVAGHFEQLLTSIVTDSSRAISSLPILSDDEQKQLLTNFNQTDRDYRTDLCVQEVFEAQVERTPDALAVQFEDQTLTYAELNSRANQLAHHLRSLGVRRETLVAICVERSVEMFVGLVGILKAGAAYLPLDASYPMPRLVAMLEDSQAPVLLTQDRLVDSLPALSGQVICLDTDWNQIARKSTENPALITNPANLAYVIYTSGSKGQPHGVEVSHAALMNLVNWHQEAFEVTPADRATQIASPSFDASVWEVWPYLCCGASLHVAPEDARLSPAQLQQWLISRDITISFVPTPLADLMIGMEWPATLPLRILLTGGDQLHQHSRDAFKFKLVNNYGPTENAVVTTSGTVVSCENALAWPSIGFSIANTRCYVLDELLRPVPLGVRGELYIAGRGLARGYLRQPALTAERFIPNPFGSEPGTRIYKSGDAVRQLADGSFEFLGRLDQQVKIRGFRIELGEIETTLSQHPTVDQCAVLARTPETSEEKQLVAYVVSKPEAVPEPAELRRYLQERLPDYMVVAHFVMLDEMPLTSNAKIDRRALLALDYVGAEVERAYVAPRTQVEEVLADIWAEVLGRERVGIDDDFFDLGGHSLLATQVIARVRDTFQVTLPVRTVFEARTIADLSLALTTNEAQPGSTEKIARVVIRLKNMSEAEKAEILQRQKNASVSLTQ